MTQAGVPILPMYTTNINTAYSTLNLTRSKKFYLLSEETNIVESCIFLCTSINNPKKNISKFANCNICALFRPFSQFVYSTTR